MSGKARSSSALDTGASAGRGRWRATVAPGVAGLAAGWLAFSLLVWLDGESPRAIGALLLSGTWGVPYGVGQILAKATPLLLTGAAVDLALRGGLFNIGAEGQLAVAGLAVAFVGARLPPSTPWWIALPLVVSIAPAAGALWAALPALLRARFGAHEVISTIMMNRIADAAVALALTHGLALPGTVRTPDVVRGAKLSRLDSLAGSCGEWCGGWFGLASLRGSAVSLALPLSVAVAVLAAWWLRRARIGREIGLVGLAPVACAAERIPVARRLGLALVVSGALAGLAAVGPVLGDKGYYEGGLGAGAGFGGIAVALLGRGSAAGLVLAALLFGMLEQGGLVINARVPMEVTTVLQAVVIAAVALADARVRAALRRRGSSAAGVA